MTRRILTAMALLSLAATATADLTTDLQDILGRTLTENPIAPGICAHVECPPLGLNWTGAAGTAAHDSAELLTIRHTFRIASNTKTYTAATLLRLAEEGRLNLDDPLGRHLAAEERDLLAGDGYDLEAITLRHVLSHTAGLADHSDGDTYSARIIADPQHHWTRGEVLAMCVELFDPVGAPGERYKYSDTGYILLGAIIERTTGENLGRAAHRLLDYERLGLGVTWWEIMEDTPLAAGPRAHQYLGELDCTDFHPSLDLYGGGGLVTDVVDLARFMRFLLQGEVFHEEATLADMTGGGTAPYRLGLMCEDLAGYLAFGHQGFWNTFAFHLPALDLTVSGAILNHDAVNGRELAAEITGRVAEARIAYGVD
jgi:D-alanyl-D-alanine carboxypeptidase